MKKMFISIILFFSTLHVSDFNHLYNDLLNFWHLVGINEATHVLLIYIAKNNKSIIIKAPKKVI